MREAPTRKAEKRRGFSLLAGVSLQVTICANARGTKIKSGSMGQASPPYDVQVGQRDPCAGWAQERLVGGLGVQMPRHRPVIAPPDRG